MATAWLIIIKFNAHNPLWLIPFTPLKALCHYIVDVLLLKIIKRDVTFRDVFCIFLAQKNGNVRKCSPYINAENSTREVRVALAVKRSRQLSVLAVTRGRG